MSPSYATPAQRNVAVATNVSGGIVLRNITRAGSDEAAAVDDLASRKKIYAVAGITFDVVDKVCYTQTKMAPQNEMIKYPSRASARCTCEHLLRECLLRSGVVLIELLALPSAAGLFGIRFKKNVVFKNNRMNLLKNLEGKVR